VVPVSEALPHLHPPIEQPRLTVAVATSEYMTTGKVAQKDWRKHTLQCYTLFRFGKWRQCSVRSRTE
jgi:hypothetical protein